MAKIFITGSTDGLGLLSAKALIKDGHQVALHARNEQRKRSVLEKEPGAQDILTGDLSDIGETKKLAEHANALGEFDAIVHNAGVYNVSAEQIFHVNVLAPYLLTCLIKKPKRLIYLSSGMHFQGNINPGIKIDHVTYSDSKLYVLMLSLAVARRWTDVNSNVVDPGWVPTKMGGQGAPDNLQKGYETQVWLSVSDDTNAKVSGRYFFHKAERNYNRAADNIQLQEKLLNHCEDITGIHFPH